MMIFMIRKNILITQSMILMIVMTGFFLEVTTETKAGVALNCMQLLQPPPDRDFLIL